MTCRALRVLALAASLAIAGGAAFADAPPDAGPNGGQTGAGEGQGQTKDKDKDKDKQPAPQHPCGGSMTLPLVLLGGLMLMIMMSSRGKKKQQAKHNEMLSGLKKGDKVRTIGGILGSVVEVRDDEVVLRIDDNANTRMRVVRRAIAGQVIDGKKDDEDAR